MEINLTTGKKHEYKVKVFYSYSHKDEAYREELETHLAILRRNGSISEWHDRRISAGSDWEEDINCNLEDADIILLLVSSNFLASDYCYDTETIRALEKHKANEAVVIPIILNPCLWQHSELNGLQALPRDGKAISTFPNIDEAWLAVAEGIIQQIDTIRKTKQKASQAHKSEALTQKTLADSAKIEAFLKRYSQWYFSPLRVKKWGGRQPGYEELALYSTKDIKQCLINFKIGNTVTTKISAKGNTIYKYKT